jgi:hypothetical protein
MLLFKKKFLELIRAGSKSQTIRLWKVCRFRAGQRSYIPGVGYIRITEIDPVQLEELTDDDARLDGFASAAALLAEVHSLYADRLAEGYRAFRLRFRVLSAEETAVELAERPVTPQRRKRTQIDT